jgi:hypothetical protein
MLRRPAAAKAASRAASHVPLQRAYCSSRHARLFAGSAGGAPAAASRASVNAHTSRKSCGTRPLVNHSLTVFGFNKRSPPSACRLRSSTLTRLIIAFREYGPFLARARSSISCRYLASGPPAAPVKPPLLLPVIAPDQPHRPRHPAHPAAVEPPPHTRDSSLNQTTDTNSWGSNATSHHRRVRHCPQHPLHLRRSRPHRPHRRTRHATQRARQHPHQRGLPDPRDTRQKIGNEVNSICSSGIAIRVLPIGQAAELNNMRTNTEATEKAPASSVIHRHANCAGCNARLWVTVLLACRLVQIYTRMCRSHIRHVRSCPAAEQAPDRPDLYAAIRRDHKWRGRTERRISRYGCDQRASRNATIVPKCRRTERRIAMPTETVGIGEPVRADRPCYGRLACAGPVDRMPWGCPRRAACHGRHAVRSRPGTRAGPRYAASGQRGRARLAAARPPARRRRAGALTDRRGRAFPARRRQWRGRPARW